MTQACASNICENITGKNQHLLRTWENHCYQIIPLCIPWCSWYCTVCCIDTSLHVSDQDQNCKLRENISNKSL